MTFERRAGLSSTDVVSQRLEEFMSTVTFRATIEPGGKTA